MTEVSVYIPTRHLESSIEDLKQDPTAALVDNNFYLSPDELFACENDEHAIELKISIGKLFSRTSNWKEVTL